MRQETKIVAQPPITMCDADGHTYGVDCILSMLRVEFLDGSWSDWQVTSRRFAHHGQHINQLADGWYEFAMSGKRIRLDQPAAT